MYVRIRGLCKLFGHARARRRLECADGTVVLVDKCKRCGYTRSSVIPPEVAHQIEELLCVTN